VSDESSSSLIKEPNRTDLNNYSFKIANNYAIKNKEQYSENADIPVLKI
jgi:hypothetical protein